MPNVSQAQQEHDEAKELFDLMNDQLISELPQLLDLRIPYFDPSFEAMIRMQAKFAEEGYEKLSGVQRQVFCLYCNLGPLQSHFWNSYFADSVRDDYAAGQLDAQVSQLEISAGDLPVLHLCQVESVLQEMRELSICGGNWVTNYLLPS